VSPPPPWLVAVLGTATEVGKTWVACAMATEAQRQGLRLAARKPAQSFDPDPAPGTTDAELLAAATGDDPARVCPPHRWYPAAMAPPMAADALDLPGIAAADLLGDLTWPAPLDVGLVEMAGGVRSPVAHDADSADLAHALAPDLVVLVADAGLGTISAVRQGLAALAPLPTIVLLNRFDADDDLHRRNRAWLTERDGVTTEVDPAAVPLQPTS
jgi:dethiobiotin synthetase